MYVLWNLKNKLQKKNDNNNKYLSFFVIAASVNSDISNSTDTLNNTITNSTESSESTKPSGSIESGTELGESTIEPNLEYSESTESSTEPSIEVN